MSVTRFMQAAIGRMARIAGRVRGMRITRAGIRIPISVVAVTQIQGARSLIPWLDI